MPLHIVLTFLKEINDIKERVISKFGNLKIPNFVPLPSEHRELLQQEGNLYTDRLLELLELDHIWTVASSRSSDSVVAPPSDVNALSIDDL
jgi:hypothetical protein